MHLFDLAAFWCYLVKQCEKEIERGPRVRRRTLSIWNCTVLCMYDFPRRTPRLTSWLHEGRIKEGGRVGVSVTEVAIYKRPTLRFQDHTTRWHSTSSNRILGCTNYCVYAGLRKALNCRRREKYSILLGGRGLASGREEHPSSHQSGYHTGS